MTTVIACGLAVLLATPAAAQTAPAPNAPAAAAPIDAARLAAATRLIDLMQLETTLDRMFVPLAPVFARSVIGAMADDAQGKQLLGAVQQRQDGQDRLVAILSQEFLKEIQRQYPALKRGAAEEYAALFTREELEAIAAFYQTGPGAKMVRLQTELQQKMAQRGQALGREAGMEAGQRAFQRARLEILELNDRPKA